MLGLDLGFTTCANRRRAAGGESFSPADLPSLQVWYDPADVTTLFQDDAASLPITLQGQSVGAVLDKSGNDMHLTQTVTASRPIYRAPRWLDLDGSDDEMRAAVSEGGYPIFAAAIIDTKTDFSATGTVFSFHQSASIYKFLQVSGGNQLVCTSRFGATTTHQMTLNGLSTDGKFVVSVLMDGVNMTISANGVSSTSPMTGGAGTPAELLVGKFRNSSPSADLGVGEFIWLNSADQAEIDQVHTYLGDKIGVSI